MALSLEVYLQVTSCSSATGALTSRDPNSDEEAGLQGGNTAVFLEGKLTEAAAAPGLTVYAAAIIGLLSLS